MARDDYATREQQIVALSVFSFSCTLSIAGSFSIIVLILRNKKWRSTNGGLFHRLMLGISVSDTIASMGLLISPYLQPRNEYLMGARGNTASCSFAGALIYTALLAIYYNCSLAFYYYRTIVKGEKEDKLSRLYEKWMHGVPICLYVVFNAVALGTKAYNPWEASRSCAISHFPMNCQDDPNVECTRGLYTMELGYSALGLIAVPSVTGVVLTVLVYLHVRRILIASQKYRYEDQEQENRRKHQVALQSVWYCVAYVNVLLWVASFTIFDQTTTNTASILGSPQVFTYLLLHSFFFPLQGFINFINFVRPRYLMNRKTYSDRSCCYSLVRVYQGNSGEGTATGSGGS